MTRQFKIGSALAICWLLGSSYAEAMWPFTSDEGPRRGSPEWYESRANEAVGRRQRYYYGKRFPYANRPCGDELPCAHKYYANMIWPYPYVGQDRVEVQNICQMQISNGWAAETTFYDYHFDPASNELNSAGRQHLYWIMTHAPIGHRQAFLGASLGDDQLSSVRLASVQKEAAKNSDVPFPVVVRITSPTGTPAEEVQAMFKARQDSPIPPIISYQSTQGASK